MEAKVTGSEDVTRPVQGSCGQHRRVVITKKGIRCSEEEDGDSEAVEEDLGGHYPGVGW